MNTGHETLAIEPVAGAQHGDAVETARPERLLLILRPDRLERRTGTVHVLIVVAAADADRAHHLAFQHDRKAAAGTSPCEAPWARLRRVS